MRLVASRAALTQCLMLKYMRPGLFRMTTYTDSVSLLRSQTRGSLMDVGTVRFMAVITTHTTLQHSVMVRHGELAMRRDMTLEAGQRIFARIHDISGKTCLNMFATCAVTRFTTGNRGPVRGALSIKTTMRTSGNSAWILS